MLITVYKEIKKRESLIIETFTFSPKIKSLIDDHNNVRDFLILLTSQLSIAPEYNLISFVEKDYIIERQYEYAKGKRVPIPSLSFQFTYIPFNGKKKCSKCFHNRYYGKIQYCSGRMRKINYDYWQDCNFYKEDSKIFCKTDISNVRIFND